MTAAYDAVVVGAGPNGLVAAVTLARAGASVLVVEQAERVGGGSRSEPLTLPGFVHDLCSAVHPLGVASPVLRALPLAEHGLEWLHPDAPLAHPLDGGTAVVLERSVDETAAGLGGDAHAYRRLMGPLVAGAEAIARQFFGPFRLPRHPLVVARFGLPAVRSANGLAGGRFEGERARALLAGLAGHSVLPLDRMPSAAAGLMLGLLGHASGWPVARGGSQRIADALAAYLVSLGGTIETGRLVTSVDELPPARAVLLDVAPRGLLALAGHRLTPGFRRSLARWRHGPGTFKVDYALDGPVPWAAAGCARAGTVHLGGTMAEIAAAEREVARGGLPERPFVLLAQQSLFDDSRAPAGQHTVWAYCHVPRGSAADATERVSAQVERFAPGFRDRVLAVRAHGPADLEASNPNYVGGDISGGTMDLRQTFVRPTPRLYRTPDPALYLCSSSTPPGGGVHGMCGYWAARAALRALTANRRGHSWLPAAPKRGRVRLPEALRRGPAHPGW